MTLRKSLWAAATGLTAGAVLGLRRSMARPADPAAADRWLTVTINRSPADVQADELPTPLQEYGDRIETRIRPAPGDRGAGLAVRLKDVPSDALSVPARLTGQDPRQDLRRSLREAKALLEAGEVLLPDTPPTTHDKPVTSRTAGEGVGAGWTRVVFPGATAGKRAASVFTPLCSLWGPVGHVTQPRGLPEAWRGAGRLLVRHD